MANIDFGAIKSAGRKVGRGRAITGFIARQEEAEEREKAHKRILEREELNREFQAKESEKTRAVTREQMAQSEAQFEKNLEIQLRKIGIEEEQVEATLEATRHARKTAEADKIWRREQAAKTETFRQWQIQNAAKERLAAAGHRKKQLEIQERQVTNEETRRKQNVQENKFAALLQSRIATKKPFTAEEIKNMSERFPLVTALDLRMRTTNANITGLETEKLTALAKETHKSIVKGEFTKGSISQEQLTSYQKVNPFFKNLKNLTDLNNIIAYHNKRKAAGGLNPMTEMVSIGNTSSGEDLVVSVPNFKAEKELRDIKAPGDRLRATSESLIKFDTQIKNVVEANPEAFENTEDNKNNLVKLTDAISSQVRKFSLGFSIIDTKGETKGKKTFISKDYLFKHAPFIKKLADEGTVDVDTIIEQAGIVSIAPSPKDRTGIERRQIPINNKEGIVETKSYGTISNLPLISGLKDDGKNIRASSVVATFFVDVNKFKDQEEAATPFGQLIIKRSNLFSQWMNGNFTGEVQTEDGRSIPIEDALMNTLQDGDGNVLPEAYAVLSEALREANPEKIYTKRPLRGSHVLEEDRNPRLQDRPESDIADIEKNARDAIREGDEVKRLAQSVKMIVEAQPEEMMGVAGDVAGWFDKAGSILKTVPKTLYTSIRQVARSTFGMQDINKKTPTFLEGMKTNGKRIYHNRGIGDKGNQAEKKKLRDNMLADVEETANKQLKAIAGRGTDETLALHGIGKDAVDANGNLLTRARREELAMNIKVNRQRVVLKKIALTYRMSGLLQGDSSGRTISNADFDVALRALWGEEYAIGAKMDDIIKFFEYRNSIAKVQRDHAKSGLLTPAEKLNEAFTRRKSIEFERSLLSDNPADSFLKRSSSSIAAKEEKDDVDRTIPSANFKPMEKHIDTIAVNALTTYPLSELKKIKRPSDFRNPIALKGGQVNKKGLVSLRRRISKAVARTIFESAKKDPKLAYLIQSNVKSFKGTSPKEMFTPRGLQIHLFKIREYEQRLINSWQGQK